MNLEKIREQKLKELQEKQAEEEKLQQDIALLENNAKQFLDKGALIRYGNLKSAFPEKIVQIALIINRLVQEGQLNKKLNDMEFKELLKNLTPKKKEIRIIRK